MNVLFINSIREWGGGEVWLMDAMSGMRDRGHSVTLLCRPNIPLAGRAMAEGFDVVTDRFGGDLDPFAIWRIRNVMKSRAIDTVCTNTEKDLRLGGIAGKLAGVRAIIPSREVDFPLKPKLAYRLSYKYLATKILVNSLATQRTLLASAPYLPQMKTTVVYKGIDSTRYEGLPGFSLHHEFRLRPTTPIVLFVGRLDERKGLRVLLEAWKETRKLQPHAVLLIVGEGAMRAEIQNTLDREGLGSSVILAGFREDVRPFLLQSTMLVCPSVWEGFGYVLVEAMAARIPVVATRVSSIPEIVVDGKSGTLVEPGNPRAIREAICDLLDHPGKAKAMGEFGHRVVESKFTLRHMIDELEWSLQGEHVNPNSFAEILDDEVHEMAEVSDLIANQYL